MNNLFVYKNTIHKSSVSRGIKLIHVTKTAGTSLENAGKSENLLLGRFHDELKKTSLKNKDWWHCPTSTLPVSLQVQYDWFLVCRNPFERIVSEFHCRWGGVGERSKDFSVSSFNSYTIRRILQFYCRDKISKRFMAHYQRQSVYLEGPAKKYILRFESLESDLKKLANVYLELKKLLPLKKHNVSQKKFTSNDFWLITRWLIRAVYRDDFYNFGYSLKLKSKNKK